MSFKTNLLKAAGLGVIVTGLTAGAAFAAVATSTVNVRTGPGTGYGVVDVLRPGEFVSITGQSGGWCEVNKPGPDGWVSCAYLTGGRVNVYRDYPRFRDYPRDYYRYDEGPSVNFSFGFGSPHPMHPWWW